MKKRFKDPYDFHALGNAIREARDERGLTREQVGEMLDIDPRYYTDIENYGQHPSFQLFYMLVTMFDVSVDQYLFPEKKPVKSSKRRQLDSLLDGFSESDLAVMLGAAKGIAEVKKTDEE